MTNARCFNQHNITFSIGDLCVFGGRSTAIDVLDVVEDAKTAQQLRNGLNELDLRVKFEIERTTEDYVRLKGFDALGNTRYLKAQF